MSSGPNDDVAVRLTEAVARILGSAGPAGLTLRSVAAEAETSTMGVYSRFGSMPGLVHATITEANERLARRLRAIPVSDDPVRDLVAVGVAYLENARANPTLYAVMMGAAPLGKYSEDSLLEHVSAGQNIATLTDAVTRAMSTGAIHAESADSFAAQLLAAMHGFVLFEAQGVYAPDTAVTTVLAPLMRSILMSAGVDGAEFDAALREAFDTQETVAG